MSSLPQIEANRRNARLSTGPTTEDGKKRSRQNALRHGLTAETVIAALEDAEDYAAFEMAVTADYDAQAYRPDLMERELKILAEIDKRIETTMVHLVSLKEYKKLYGTKEVKARQAEVPSLPVEQP